jgi:hypothetical protein
MAVLAGDFIGVEIKSCHDSLRRLPRQLSTYTEFFDRTILVVAEKHLPGVRALDLSGVELWYQRGSCVEPLAVYPRSAQQRSLNELLTRAQVNRWGPHGSANGREAFVSEFSERYWSTSREFWTAVGRRAITPCDLGLLSRLRRVRLEQARLRLEREGAWTQWAEEMPA